MMRLSAIAMMASLLGSAALAQDPSAQDDGAAQVTQGQDASPAFSAGQDAPAAVAGLTLITPWRGGPSLDSARAGLAAAELGGAIYAAGGAGLVDPRDDFDVYEPEIGRWIARPALPQGLERFAMVASGDRLYVAGGYSAESGSEPIASVWSYDPQSNVWRSEPEMPGAKASFSMLGFDGKLYALGGEDGASGMFVYDPETLEWTTLDAPTEINRRGASAVVAADKFWLLGGALDGDAVARVDVFDPSLGVWSEGPDLPEPRAGHAAATLEGAIHIFGGRSADMRRTLADHWVLEAGAADWQQGPSMPSARTEAAATALDGEVWLIGGGAGAGFFAPFTAIDTVDVLQDQP